jgi:hypothetical protein
MKDRATYRQNIAAAGRLSLTVLAVAMGALTAEAAPPGGYTFSVVATLGDPAPGGGRHINDLEPGDINGRGDVAFASDLQDDNGTFLGEGLYARYHGFTRAIARSGDPIPGTQLSYGAGILSPPGMNDSGDIAFGFLIDVPSNLYQTGAAVFRYELRSNRASAVFLPGDPAPGKTTFRGTDFHTDINNRGQIATVAIIDTADGNCTDPTAACFGLGRGVYTFDRFNNVTKIAAPGDSAPGSISTFDDAWDPNLNNPGDVIFGGHVHGEACVDGSDSALGCFESLYLYRAGTRRLSSIAHQGQPAPGGGIFKYAFNGRLNEAGDASFIGGLNEDQSENGVFLHKHDGTLLAVARVGDPLPGGTMKNAAQNQGSHAIDNAGNVAFSAVLDADSDHDGVDDTGVYLWSRGAIKAVVRTGTVIPGLGTVAHVNNEDDVHTSSWPEVHINESGQILTQVIMNTGANYVVLATPK